MVDERWFVKRDFELTDSFGIEDPRGVLLNCRVVGGLWGFRLLVMFNKDKQARAKNRRYVKIQISTEPQKTLDD